MSLEIDLSKDGGHPRERMASESSGDKTSVGVEVVVNISHRDEDRLSFDWDRSDRIALDHLRDLPTGSHLRVVLGRREFPGGDAVRMLRWLRDRGVIVTLMADYLDVGLAWQHAVMGTNGEAA